MPIDETEMTYCTRLQPKGEIICTPRDTTYEKEELKMKPKKKNCKIATY